MKKLKVLVWSMCLVLGACAVKPTTEVYTSERGVVAVIASWQRSYVGVCLASPMAWVLAGALLLWMYFKIMRNLDQNPSA